MKNTFTYFISSLLAVISFSLTAQQQAVVISRCGGADTLQIPSIIDNDYDGMDDGLEQILLQHFMPVFIQFNDDGCPGPALDGTGDSNLVLCHIFSLPGQYLFAANLDSLKVHPAAPVSDTSLATGMVWYQPVVMVNAALIYGKDCGLAGHTADVEGFTFSLKYTGPDSLAGWMYDTQMQNWKGGTIQTISHASTLCEKIETEPFAPNGFDTLYASPDKHGNHLTVSGCNSAIICDPPCNGTPSVKAVNIINLGEQDAPLVTDLGNYYAAYAGEDPWGSDEFLQQQGGSAGAIRNKMVKPLTADFIAGQTLDSPGDICELYRNCYACGDSIYDLCLLSGDTVLPGTTGFSPWYNCPSGTTAIFGAPSSMPGEPQIYPTPADKVLFIINPNAKMLTATIHDGMGRELRQVSLTGAASSIDISELLPGFYMLRLTTGNNIFIKKMVVSGYMN